MGTIHRVAWPVVNTYLIEEHGRIAVVDPGYPRFARRIEEVITRDLSASMHDVDLVVVTHSHPDHCGCVDALMARCPDARLAASPRAAAHVRDPRSRPTRAQLAIGVEIFGNWLRTGCPAPRMSYETPVAVALADGDRLPGAFESWTALLTPGHASDQVSLYHEAAGALIGGDVIANTTGTPRPTGLVVDPSAMNDTLLRLRSLAPRALYPGHGEPVVAEDLCAVIDWDALTAREHG